MHTQRGYIAMLKDLDKVEGLTSEQIEAINSLAKPVIDKKEELLSKLAKKDDPANASELERLRQFEQATNQQNAEAKQNYEEALGIRETQYNNDLEKYKADMDALKGQLRSVLVDKGLSDALDAVNINPALKQGAIAMLQSQIEIQNGQAVAGEASLSDFIKEWSDSDTGKAFTLAPQTSGAGVQQSNGYNGQAKSLAEMSEAERVNLYRTDPAKFQQLQAN